MLRVKIHPETIPVKGFNRSAIYDLPRKTFYLVPNSVVDFLAKIDGRVYEDFVSGYTVKEKAIFDEYMRFLLEREIIFLTKSRYHNSFSLISLDWDYPGLIQKATIDYNETYSCLLFFNVLSELDRIGAKTINIRLLTKNTMSTMHNIMEQIHESGFNQVNFFLDAQSDIDIMQIKKIINNNNRINWVQIHNAKQQSIEQNATYRICSIMEGFENQYSLAYNRFVVDISIFTQAHHYNVFFNKYLYISKEGEIRNSLRSQCKIGDIYHMKSLEEIVSDHQYTRLFFSKKDDTCICKDCEFRYMCLSNRNLHKNKHYWQITSQDECNYNPYISKWQKEDGFYSIHEIGYFLEGNYFIDQEKISKINHRLWKT